MGVGKKHWRERVKQKQQASMNCGWKHLQLCYGVLDNLSCVQADVKVLKKLVVEYV